MKTPQRALGLSVKSKTVQYLGTDANGYQYYLHTDGYVYNYHPDGMCIGWICSQEAWIRTMHKIII